MRKILYRRSVFLLPAMVLLGLSACRQPAPGKQGLYTLFNDGWEFLIDSLGAPVPAVLEGDTPEEGWTEVSLPHTPRIEPLLVNDQWQGDCWYRKDFLYQDAWAGKKILLRFEAAMNVATVWLNGKELIRHSGGYLPFTVDLGAHLHREGPNRLHVKLNNEDNVLTGPKPLDQLDFNMYGGLYRDVWLIARHPVHISDEQLAGIPGGGGIFVSFPEVSREHARLEVSSHVVHDGDISRDLSLRLSLLSEGKLVAGDTLEIRIEPGSDREITSFLEVDEPRLWSPATPHLHDLYVEIAGEGGILERRHLRVGIRQFGFREGRLLVNGEETFLRGVNRHQEYPYIGYALSNNAQYRDAVKIKEAGFDYVRLSHYPHSPAFLDACDELGLITINPILGWQFFNPDRRFREQVFSDARSLIRRDRNHACVLAWELSLNESSMPRSFIDTLVGISREEYPVEPCLTAGWLAYGYDIYLQARQHRIGHPAYYPPKPYVVSEYGDWEYYAMNAGLKQDDWEDLLPSERSSRQLLGSSDRLLLQQALNVQEAHNDNLSTPAFADGYWVMFDYNRGYATDLEASGVMSIFRQPKFAYYFFRSQRDPGEIILGREVGPMVRIASRLMEDAPGQVRVFSNCEEVELLVNGQPGPRQGPDQDRISSHLANPPFTFSLPGVELHELTAIGRIAGKEVARNTLVRPGRAAAIELEADLAGRPLESGSNDAIFIHARVVDSLGHPVSSYEGKIHFSLEGDGLIHGSVAPEAGAGQAAILLQAGSRPGPIQVKARAEGLADAELEVQSFPPALGE